MQHFRFKLLLRQFKPIKSMSHVFFRLCLAFGVLIPLSGTAQKVPKKMDLYLLIGQSNMAGRGKVPVDNPPREGIWVINASDDWAPAKDPLHYDKPKAVGVGPGLAFAEAIRKHRPKRPIGLIPCAVGGSAIADWEPGIQHDQTGIYAYDAMLLRVKAARKHGKLKAILWHQGEGDSSPVKSSVYEERLTRFFERLRTDLDIPEIPILVGTLGDFYVRKNPGAAAINEILTRYPSQHPNVYTVSAAGLDDLGDTTHFNTEAATTLGKRYADALLKINP